MQIEEYICKECNLSGFKLRGSGYNKFEKHLVKNHNITYKEYIIKYYHNNKIPLCKCGCGINVEFNKGKFNEYIFGHVHIGRKNKVFNKNKSEDEILNLLNKISISKEKLKDYYEKYINFEIDMKSILEDITLDKRTLINYWIKLKFISNKEEFRRITKKHQYIWADKNNKKGGRQNIDENLLFDIYQFILNNKNKYSINEIRIKFNIKHSNVVIYNRLKDKFGKNTIDDILYLGLSSKPENEFYNILSYFFKDIKKQFKLEGKYFDIKLGDNILIEFDGDYWHSLEYVKENDKFKNNLAKKYKYHLIRVKESEANNIDILFKIKQVYENQTKRNKQTNYKK